MKRVYSNFTKYRFLLVELVKKDIKLKYRSSILGLFWTLLEPLLTMVVLTIIFQSMFPKKIENFPVYILTGRLLYSYFSNGTKLALKSIRRNSSMIRKVYVPKYMYPMGSAISGYITFLISLIVLVVVGAIQGLKPTLYLFQGIIPMITILVMVIGIGFILATLDVFFRDMEYLWSVLMLLIMYASAIFYEADSLLNNPKYGWIIKYNPLYSIIANFRNAVFGRPMDNWMFAYSSIFSIIVLLLGVILFYKKQDKFVLYI